MTTSTNDAAKKRVQGTTSSLRRYWNQIPDGTIVPTREVLPLGPRDALDKAFSRLCACGKAVRLARGLYLKTKKSEPEWRPPIQDIVLAKLRAFQRDAVPAPSEEPFSKEIPQRSSKRSCRESAADIHLDTTGSTSAFRLYNGVLVRLRHIASRKFDLAQSAIGKKIRVLWEAADNLKSKHLTEFKQALGREERKDVKVLIPLFPQWLSDPLGVPWTHKWEVHRFPRSQSDCSSAHWFSKTSVSHSRAYRSSSRPPPLDCDAESIAYQSKYPPIAVLESYLQAAQL